MTFNRWTSKWPRTWPFAIFKRHHTELNDHYWSYAASVHHSRIASRSGKDEDGLNTVLATPQANARRVNFTVKQWRQLSKESENWIRLNALMALSGYLETYLHGVVLLALTSDPGLLLSSPHSVDGISLVKRGKLPDFSVQVAGITKGNWQGRIGNYKTLFEIVPNPLADNVLELEAMRKLRNGVGHAFGRMIDDYRDPLLFEPIPSQRLSEERLQKWLGVVEEIVNAVDEHLRIAHIGAIEALLRYHSWDKKYDAGQRSEEWAFRRQFPHLQGSPPSVAYFKQLISHYKVS